MLPLDDPRWERLKGGYRIPVDLRPLLRRLESGQDAPAAWGEVWQELYHQGDVDEASFVALPHLVRIHRKRGVVELNTYALATTIELARATGKNPDVPEWAESAYQEALKDLTLLGLQELPQTAGPEAVRSILAFLALVHGARTYARMLWNFSEDEMLALERAAFGD